MQTDVLWMGTLTLTGCSVKHPSQNLCFANLSKPWEIGMGSTFAKRRQGCEQRTHQSGCTLHSVVGHSCSFLLPSLFFCSFRPARRPRAQRGGRKGGPKQPGPPC